MFATFGVGQALWSMVWFFLFVMWIMLVFQVFGDIFRSRDLSGVVKALWVLFVVVTPYLGVFVYLIVRGPTMASNQVAAVQQQEAAVQDYIRTAAGTSPAAELAALVELRDKGDIDAAEFAAMKARIVG